MKIGVNKKLGHHAHLARLHLELGGGVKTGNTNLNPFKIPFLGFSLRKSCSGSLARR